MGRVGHLGPQVEELEQASQEKRVVVDLSHAGEQRAHQPLPLAECEEEEGDIAERRLAHDRPPRDPCHARAGDDQRDTGRPELRVRVLGRELPAPTSEPSTQLFKWLSDKATNLKTHRT